MHQTGFGQTNDSRTIVASAVEFSGPSLQIKSAEIRRAPFPQSARNLAGNSSVAQTNWHNRSSTNFNHVVGSQTTVSSEYYGSRVKPYFSTIPAVTTKAGRAIDSNSLFRSEQEAPIVVSQKKGESETTEAISFQIEGLIDELSGLVMGRNQSYNPAHQFDNGAVLANGPKGNEIDDSTAYNNATMGHYTDGMTNLASHLSRPMQRKLLNLFKCKLVYCSEAKSRLVRSLRLIGERALTDLLMMHQNPACLTKNLWLAVRNRGCQFLGPAMQEEVLRLILLALEDGSALSRKVLVLFVVQKLQPRYPRASKTNVGHVVQLLYRASCFKLQKRNDDSSLMQLKDDFRNYDSLRREHDAQIIQIAMDACLKISPESWSSLLYGDTEHRSQMQSITDRLQLNQIHNFPGMLRELQNALQRTGDPYELGKILPDLDYIDRNTRDAAATAEVEDKSGEVQQLQVQAVTPPEAIDEDVLLEALKRTKSIVLACARASRLIRQRCHNIPSFPSPLQYQKQYHSTLDFKEAIPSANPFVGFALQQPVKTFARTSAAKPPTKLCANANLYRTWSSMNSVINPLELNKEATEAIDYPWIGHKHYDLAGGLPSVMITAADSEHQAKYNITSSTPFDNDFNSNVPHSNIYSSESNLSMCSGQNYEDMDDIDEFQDNVAYRYHYSQPHLPLGPPSDMLSPPPSMSRPVALLPNWQSNKHYAVNDNGMQNLRHWMSMCAIPTSWNTPEQHRSTLDLNCIKDDDNAYKMEYQNLLSISSRIHDLERQKRDIIKKLNDVSCGTAGYGRNACSSLNLASHKPFALSKEEVDDFENKQTEASAHAKAMTRWFTDMNDRVINPFACSPAYGDKTGSILRRSHRRLTKSLLAFQPLPENNGDLAEDHQEEDILFEHTNKVISQILNDESDTDESVPAPLTHARSLSAIQDELASSKQRHDASRADENRFKWMNAPTLDDPLLKYSLADLCNQIDEISTSDFCKSKT